jgi:hypothetical protein
MDYVNAEYFLFLPADEPTANREEQHENHARRHFADEI